jgi:class 3 adenylate cyclase
MQKLNAIWNQVLEYFFCGRCTTHRRLKDGDGDDDNNYNNSNNDGTLLAGDGTAAAIATKMKDASHRQYRGESDVASSKTSSHAAAAAAVEEYQNRQRSSWGGRMGQTPEEERQNTWSRKVKQVLRKLGILGKDHTEWQRQMAAIKIQRAWRRALARKAGQSDFFREELGMMPSIKDANFGNSSSLTPKSSSRKKSFPRSLRKMSLHPGMDAAVAATARISQKLKYATGGDSAAESQVGGAMRELTGQRVAIGILLALFLTATFTYVEDDATRPATMVILHAQTTGTSISPDGMTTITQPPPQSWIETALNAARRSAVPDLYQFDAATINGSHETYQFAVEENQDLRNRERLQVTIKSTNMTSPSNSTMASVGWFAYRGERQNEALVQLFSTIFILLLWLFGVTAFAGPVMVLVVLPIERMVRLLGMLMVDPLGYQSTSRYRCFVAEEDELTKNTRWSKEVLKGMETSFLMSTILRIGSLMKVGFGSAGVEIIRKNLEKKQGGVVNLQTSKGVTVSCIFLFCDIRQFTDATECLQEEVFVFTNRIAAVVHSHCHSFGGSANKNVGDAFLCSWLLDDPPNDGGFGGDDQLYAKTNQADKCLMCVVKIIMALHHDSYYIETMSEAPRQRLLAKLKKRPGPIVQMGCGLHAGKAVQGAIGSERKIDATYVSEAVEMSEFLESSTKKYGLKMLMSNSFYNLLHSNNRQRCRLVDQIVKANDDEDEDDAVYDRDDIIELYTFDMDIDALWKAPIGASQKVSGKDSMDGGSVSEDNSRQGGSDRRGDMKKVLSNQRVPGSTRLGRTGRRMSTMLTSKNAVTSSGTSVGTRGTPMEGSQHDTLGGNEHNSATMKLPEHKEVALEFRKPELVLPTGPALYTPAVWRTETMFRIRKKYLDGLFFHNYSQGLQSYYHREWDRAKQSFQAILDSFEDGPSRYFLTEMENAGGKPPPNFKPYGIA